MRTKQMLLLSAILMLSTAAAAKAPAVAPTIAPPPPGKGRYIGAHPLAGRPGAGYCYIDVPHTHDYLPDRPGLYQQTGDTYVFSGDPTPFGYEGPKTVFYGHHPIPTNVEPAVAVAPGSPSFCFMKGPHYHEYPQPEGPGFKVKDNVTFYVGPIPPAAAAVRPQVEKTLEIEYRPYVAQRPQVVVTPPVEWAGTVWVAPPAPSVVVAPAPSVVVGPVAPTVVVAPPQPAVIVAPPVPVLIGAPPVIMMGGHGKGKGWGHGRGWGWGHGGGRGRGHW